MFSSSQVLLHNFNNNSTVLYIGFSVDSYNPSKNLVGRVSYLSYFIGIIGIDIEITTN